MQESSYGVIPIRWHNNGWQILLVCNRNGNWWGFPKGHAEEGEDPHTAAERELIEETGLHITRWHEAHPFEEKYSYTRDGQEIDKTVILYVADATGVITPDPHEIAHAEWLSPVEAEARASYPEGQEICAKVRKLLEGERR